MPVYLEDYLDAVKAYLPTAKKGDRHRLLQNVTTASLRNFYINLIKEGLSKDDDESLRRFFDINQDDDLIKELKKETEKLKSVKRFIDGVTENPTQDTLEMVAIIVDFKPRPYYQFQRSGGIPIDEKPKDYLVLPDIDIPDKAEKEPSDGGFPVTTDEETNAQKNMRKPDSDNGDGDNSTEKNKDDSNPRHKSGNKRNPLIETTKPWKKIAAGVTALFLVSMGAYGVKEKFFDKECMQWQVDHYQVLDCDSSINNFMNNNPIIAYDENLVNMKLIRPCDTTRFFNEHGKALVWYQKMNNRVELFNMCGKHPVTGKALKDITGTIINNHLKPLKPCK